MRHYPIEHYDDGGDETELRVREFAGFAIIMFLSLFITAAIIGRPNHDLPPLYDLYIGP